MIVKVTITPIEQEEKCVYWFKVTRERCGTSALGQISDRWLCAAHLVKKLRDMRAEM